MLSFNLCCESSIPSEGMWLPVKTCGDFLCITAAVVLTKSQRTTTMESRECGHEEESAPKESADEDAGSPQAGPAEGLARTEDRHPSNEGGVLGRVQACKERGDHLKIYCMLCAVAASFKGDNGL